MPEKRPVEAEPAFSQFEADREQVFQYLRQDFPVLQYSNYFVAMSPFCSMVVLTGIFIPYPPLNTLQGYRDFFHRGVGSNFAGSESGKHGPETKKVSHLFITFTTSLHHNKHDLHVLNKRPTRRKNQIPAADETYLMKLCGPPRDEGWGSTTCTSSLCHTTTTRTCLKHQHHQN